MTFDDITELQSAQRKAAWADVARRIAHEIKNPLTPIQLSAERLKRRFAKEITVGSRHVPQCADTIIRHVGDIGRMVDEFSAFARMPQPVIKPEDIGADRARGAGAAEDRAAADRLDAPTFPTAARWCRATARLMRQALTNLLQNAADAVAMRDGRRAAIDASRCAEDGRRRCASASTDDGVGLPQQDRVAADRALCDAQAERHRPGPGDREEDHGRPWWQLVLDDRPDGPGAVPAWSFLPRVPVEPRGRADATPSDAGGSVLRGAGWRMTF